MGSIDIEKQVFNDCYNFLKYNIEVRRDLDYWDSIVKQTTAIEQRYKGNKFALDMLYACTQRLCELCDKQVL